MKISSIRLQGFKRFTDLSITGIPMSAKLVLLVGPNGSGKSSILDGLVWWHRYGAQVLHRDDPEYYNKSAAAMLVQVTPHGDAPVSRNSLYARTAYRNDSDFSARRLDEPGDPVDSPSFHRMIEDDKTVAGNYQRLVLETTASVFSEESADKTGREIADALIGGIRDSMLRVFGDLTINAIHKPLGSGTGSGSFYFGKGDVGSYHYKNLSGGEKAAFDLILDLHIKNPYFPDAVYCIDEIESHLHTRVQGALLRELVEIIPDVSQMWVTTHSLGVLRAAQEIERAAPGSVCLISFDGVDSDKATELRPTSLGRAAWEKMLSITLDDLSERVAPEVIVVCEGSSTGGRRQDFDADVYERIIGKHEPRITFVSGGNSHQIAQTGNSVRGILERVVPGSRVVALADRDDKSDLEISEYESNGGIVLARRNIESYLLADDVIRAFVEAQGKPECVESALEVKRRALSSSVNRGNAPDDLKSAAGETYGGLRQLLGLQQQGNSADAFMRDTLTRFVTPGGDTYEALKSDIVDKILPTSGSI